MIRLISILFCEACATSVVIIYENRYYTLFARRTLWRKFRKPVLFLLSILVPMIFIPPFFFIPNQEIARNHVFEALPCLPQIAKQKLFVLSMTWYLPTAFLTFATVLWSLIITIFEVLTFVKLWCGTHITNSTRTINLQKKFTLAVTVQVCTTVSLPYLLSLFQATFMFIMMFTPTSILLFFIFFRIHDQSVNNITLLILSFYGSSSTIVMILVHRPYREFTMSKICFWKNRKLIRICGNVKKTNAPANVVF